MKHFASVFSHMFARGTVAQTTAARDQIQRDWARQRERAMTPSERSEIDAIFARYL